MNYDINPTSSWIEDVPQTGESSWTNTKKVIALAAVSLSSGVCLPVIANEHTGYETPLSALDASYMLSQNLHMTVFSHMFDAENITDRLKRVFGLSISRQAQIFGVSRQTVYKWRNGEEPTDKNLETLADLNGAAEHFESEGIQVTGLLMKRAFFQGKSLLDLMESGASISPPAKQLVKQLKREAEERGRLAQRFANRQAPQIDFGLDLE